MRRQFAGAVVLGATAALSLLAGLSCRSADADADLAPPPGFAPPPVRPLVRNPGGTAKLGFGAGFFPIEVGDKGETWRWMGRRGEVRLANPRASATLRIVGWIPLEFLREPPTLRISLQGRVLDVFRQSERALDKQYLLAPESLGSEPSIALVLETSATARPPRDSRELGISVEQLTLVE